MDINEELDNKKNYFFDLDKTVWNWDSLILGAEDLIKSLRENGNDVYFFTDNTLLSREDYADKMSTMGIKATKEDVFTVGYALGRHLSENMVNKAYVIGESGLMDDLEDAGIEITENAETVILGFDRQFNYRKAKRAFEILQDDGRMYICSTEKSFETSETEIPHQGVFNSIFEEFENVEIAGKPGKIFLDQFRNYFDFLKLNSVLIGDRAADIETGNALGMTTAAVMSGELDKKKISRLEKKSKPDFGISSLHKLDKRII